MVTVTKEAVTGATVVEEVMGDGGVATKCRAWVEISELWTGLPRRSLILRKTSTSKTNVWQPAATEKSRSSDAARR